MKKQYLLFILLLLGTVGWSQELKNMALDDYRFHVIINLGANYHLNKTVSNSNKILGLPTFDIAPSLRFLHYYNSKKNAISVGAELSTFTNKFKTRSGFYGDYDGEFRSFVSGSIYYRVGVYYNYFIKLSNRFDMSAYIGPCYIIQQKRGVYDYYSWYAEVSENNTLLYTFENKFTATKVNPRTFGAQFGCSFIYNFLSKHLLQLNVGYNIGFKHINQTSVEVFVNNSRIDNGVIFSKADALNISLGISFPLNL